MQRQELLIVKRHHADRIVWEPRQDFSLGSSERSRSEGRDYALSHAFEVSATVISVDEGRSQVGLDADFRTSRGRSAQQTAVTSLVGASATASLFFMGVTAAVAAAPVLIVPAIGIAGARAYQGRIVTRAQLALEQLLDQLERAEYGRRGPETLLGAIVAAHPPSRDGSDGVRAQVRIAFAQRGRNTSFEITRPLHAAMHSLVSSERMTRFYGAGGFYPASGSEEVLLSPIVASQICLLDEAPDESTT
jgi:hypothetical protein